MEPRFTLSEENLVHLIALLTAAMGVINVLSAVTPSLRYRLRLLEQFSPFSVSTGGHLTSALAGFALLLLSSSLWRRKHMGWMLTLIVLLISIPAHLLKGLDYEEATLAAILVVALIYLRPHFHARSDTPSVQQGLRTLAAALVFTLAYGVIGFYLLDKHFRLTFGLWAAFRQTIVMFAEFYDPGLQPITGFGRYFADSIYIVGAVTLSYALFMLLRPVLNRHPASEDERTRAWEIVRTHGRTALARYALFEDKKFFFSARGSLISYVVQNRVALTLGDPIGPAEDMSSAITEFRELCSSNDWRPAFYQVLPTYINEYKSSGFDLLTLGQEAIVDLSGFTLEGSENKTLRNSYNKMVRLGYHYDVLQPPYSPRMLRELNTISNEWLSSRGASEMRFSLGWFDEAYLNTCSILLVRDKEGFIESFANIVTEFQACGVAVDMMRHRAKVDAGLMDFLFVSLFEWARQNEYKTFNLGLSALSGIGKGQEDPGIERALNYIYEHVNQFYNFKGLHKFKEKFHPQWSPRYLAYPGMASLPAVTVALIRADSGTDFIGEFLLRRKSNM